MRMTLGAVWRWKWHFRQRLACAFQEKFLVHGTVHGVAGGATLADGFMLEDKWPHLCGVALGADFFLGQQRRAPGASSAAFVRVVAIGAAHPAFEHRVVVGKIELAALIEVALEAGLRILTRVNDGVDAAAGLGMQAARPVAPFTTKVHGVGSPCHQARVGSRGEPPRDFLMARGAFL